MKIGQVTPLYESVPPRLYGGTERVVSYLTEELVRQGHQVTLFASGDSVTGGRLIPACSRSLRLDPACTDPLAHHMRLIQLVARHAGEFDVLHVTTLHGRLDMPDLIPLYQEFLRTPVSRLGLS